MKYLLPLLFVFIAINLDKVVFASKIELNHWYFSSPEIDKSSVDAKVPGNNIMQIIESNGWSNYSNTGHFFWDHIEEDLKFLEKSTCTYHTKFNKDDLNGYDHIELVFEGIDTYASIYLNDELIQTTDNMFRTWRIDLSSHELKEKNVLKVVLTSPLEQNYSKVSNAPYQLPSGNEDESLNVSNYTRKAAFQFGWDFAPRILSQGIWRPVYFQCWNEAIIRDVHIFSTEVSESSALLNYEIEIESDQKLKKSAILINGVRFPVKLKKGKHTYHFKKKIDSPKLWYPNGYGSPNMNLAIIKLLNEDKVLDQQAKSYGIREIKLIQEKDQIGTSFYFMVNGQRIFAKGANYIPPHIYPSQIDQITTVNLIQQIKDANMNMIRVWGGGIYESDLFYDQCDRNGILVWQDFMFANSLYPEDDEFVNTVREEVQDNVKRLRNHPCIAIWCGNNEIEVAWNNWGWQDKYGWSKEEADIIWENYQQLFHSVIPEELQKLTPHTPYVPTSPLSNWGKSENFNHSSMHYWGVWHGTDDLNGFSSNIGRFMAEYGYQSFPIAKTMRKYTMDSTFISMNEFIRAPNNLTRQKSYKGNKMIFEEIEKRYHFGISKVNLWKNPSYESWALASQFIQAIALKRAIASHRLNAPHCMGTLYWQLNDCWPGPSWSTIDFDLNNKVAFEEVKKMYSPVIAYADTSNGNFLVSMISDKVAPQNVTLELSVCNMLGRVVKSEKIVCELNFLEPKVVFEKNVSTLLNTEKTQNFSVKIRVNDRSNGVILFEDQFYFGKSPAEKSFLLNK